MNEPLVIAAIVSMIGLTFTAVITGIFACSKANNSGGCTNGLESALQGQTKAMSDLTTMLRETHTEDRGDHQQMIKCLTVLVERTARSCEE